MSPMVCLPIYTLKVGRWSYWCLLSYGRTCTEVTLTTSHWSKQFMNELLVPHCRALHCETSGTGPTFGHARGAFLTPFRVWYQGPNWQLRANFGLGVPISTMSQLFSGGLDVSSIISYIKPFLTMSKIWLDRW